LTHSHSLKPSTQARQGQKTESGSRNGRNYSKDIETVCVYNSGNANKLFVPRSLDLLILACKGAFELGGRKYKSGPKNPNMDLPFAF